jgi:alpha-D-xyloside xylohydrolase
LETRHLGIIRALGWEQTATGVEFQCVTELLAAARVTVSAVAPRVVRVRTTPGPVAPAKRFSYVVGRPDLGSWSIDSAANRVTLKTAHVVVEVTLDPWQLAYRASDGRVLTQQVHDDTNFAGHRFGPRPGLEVDSLPHDPARRVHGVVETLLLDPEDHFYGSGERFGRLDLVGRTIEVWNRNPYGARSGLAYKNLPLIVGSRGYGLFVDVSTAVGFQLGTLSNRAYTVHAAGEELDYYLMAGTPKEIVTAYTELTGRPAVPPEWAFGLWASTCFVQFTEASVLEVARRLRAEGIPCDVFHLDSFWQRAYMWCDFEWDRARIPDPRRLLAELHKEGFHNCLWINPYVSLQSDLYREGLTRGYFLRRPDGSTYHPIVWNQRTERGMGLCAIVDFTNLAAADWYRGKLIEQLDLGADSFKPDFAEEIPADAVFANGLTGVEMHNPYPLLFQKEVFEASRERADRVVAWSRSAAPGVQRYPGHWSGDPECTFVDLANTLRGGLAASMSGLAYWGHDMGGFWGDPSPELFVRWSQLGFLSALSRFHGATPREPWRFGPEALRIFKQYARLRSRLVPYLVSYGWQAADDGVPLMRSMVMEFPDDPAGYAFDLQYCLGRELLVSPVVREDGMVTTYLPRGTWTDWWTDALHQGPATIRRKVPLDELPIYARDESLVVLGPERSHVGERPADPLTVEAFVTSEAAFTVRGDVGSVSLRCRRQGSEVIFEASATPVTYVLRIRQDASIRTVSADGRPISRLDAAELERAATGWTLDGGVVVVKARASRIELR